MENEKLIKMFNLTLKRRETLLFILIVVINNLIFILAICGLDIFRIFSTFIGEYGLFIMENEESFIHLMD